MGGIFTQSDTTIDYIHKWDVTNEMSRIRCVHSVWYDDRYRSYAMFSFVTSHFICDVWRLFRCRWWISCCTYVPSHSWHLVRDISFHMWRVASFLMQMMINRHFSFAYMPSHSWHFVRDISSLVWHVASFSMQIIIKIRHFSFICVPCHSWHVTRDISFVTSRSWHFVRDIAFVKFTHP